MKFSSLVALGGLAAFVYAAPASIPYAVHERRGDIALSSQWQQRDLKVDRRATIPMSIALTQRNLEHAYDLLTDVSSPLSANYGKHWTPEKIAETFSASAESISTVTSWLVSEGISEERITISRSRNWIKFNATIDEAESLLKAEYNVYESMDGKTRRSLATNEYSVPFSVKDHVDFITPTIQHDAFLRKRILEKRAIPEIAKMVHKTHLDVKVRPTWANSSSNSSSPSPHLPPSVNPTDLSTCDKYVTTECIRALYNMPNGTLANSSLTIVEYSPQSFLPSDLNSFLAIVDPWIPAVAQPQVQFVDGAQLADISEDSLESNLDLQLSVPLVYPQEVTYIQVGDNIEGGSFNSFLDAIDASYCTSDGGDDPIEDPLYQDSQPGGFKGHNCGTFASGSVISTSYGAIEAELSTAYLVRQCNEYMKLGLQGVSVLYATGDAGAASGAFGDGQCCVNANCSGGALQPGTSGGFFSPNFAASCPYVTAVGATIINSGSSVSDPKSAASFSGGGFSNVFGQPTYQAYAVSAYLSNTTLPFNNSLFNASGRGIPDIAAIGGNIPYMVNGTLQMVGGTSASCPIVASMFTLINNRLIAAGKPVIGFANPILYAHPEAMNDIVSGNAPACNTDGFAAVPGWDPITGLGTPDYGRLLSVFMNLASKKEG